MQIKLKYLVDLFIYKLIKTKFNNLFTELF